MRECGFLFLLFLFFPPRPLFFFFHDGLRVRMKELEELRDVEGEEDGAMLLFPPFLSHKAFFLQLTSNSQMERGE